MWREGEGKPRCAVERLVFWADFQLIHKHIASRERCLGEKWKL
jgi:hypothetical protein